MRHTFRQNGCTGRITLEYWENVPSGSISSTKEDTGFPDCPDGRTTIDSLSVLAGWTDRHAVRIRGYLNPPATGKYIFTTSGDVELVLGETCAGSSACQIVSSGSKRSDPVSLETGSRYYIQAICATEDKGCDVNVGWHLPDGSQATVIDGCYLSPYNRFRDIPEAHRVLAGLSRAHPRVIASAYDFFLLRDRIRHGGQAVHLDTSPGPTPGERGAEGVRKLAIKIENVKSVRLAVALVPQGGPDMRAWPVLPLSTWSI